MSMLKKYKITYVLSDTGVRMKRIVEAKNIGIALRDFLLEFPETSVYEIMEV